MYFKNHFYGFILFFILITKSWAQKPNLVFHKLNMKDGLSENTIRCITEDNKGFMWFGTEDGLNRFDGYEFKIYRSNPEDSFSISSGNTKTMYKDSKGRLWIATRDGINLYDERNDLFYNYKSSVYPAFRKLRGDMEMMTEDAEGNIWIASSEEGLFKLSHLNVIAEKFTSGYKDGSAVFTCLAPADKDNLYLGTQDGLLLFNIRTEKFSDLRPLYGKGYEVKNILTDKQGKVILSTTDGLKVIDQEKKLREYKHDPSDPHSLLGKNVIQAIRYKDGNYLLAVDGSGIDYFDVAREKFYHYTAENESQLSANNISALFLDCKGDMWAGTYLNGINFSNSTTNLFVLIKNNPLSQEAAHKGIVSSFHKDRAGNFWMTTDGGGIYKRRKNSQKFNHYFKADSKYGLSSDAVLTNAEDKDGTIYFSTYGGGLCQYIPSLDKFHVIMPDPNNPDAISTDKIKDIHIEEDQIWISGFGTGISVMDKKTRRWKHFRHDKDDAHSIPSDYIQCFYKDSEGTLWLGTFVGLARYNREKQYFENFTFGTERDHREKSFIIDIVEDSNDNLWLGTNGGGLLLFNRKDGSYRTFSTKNGFSDNSIESFIEDNNKNLWIATNNGIIQFDIRTFKAKSYTIKDGVPPCSFFYNAKYKDENGRIYFGTNEGFLIIDPRLAIPNKYTPSIVITELKILNETVRPNMIGSPLKENIVDTRELHLSHSQNSLSFKFSALNFNNPQNNQYAYMLEGFDKEWVLSGNQRMVSYTNLNPGNYIFRIKASNNDNIWNENGISMAVIISPPFYQTWWFNTIGSMSLLCSLYFIYIFRIRNIRRKNIILEDTVKKRTKELKDANEQLETFVYRASHDIKGPLKSIIGLTTVGQKDVTDATARNYFEHILKSTRKLDNLLMDLLEVTKVKQATIKPENINFEELVALALSSFENLAEYPEMNFNISIKDSNTFRSDKKLLYSLIQNLIENPIKYRDLSKKEHTLDITIKATHTNAQLIFTDNGIGIPEEFHEKVFDMFFKVNDSSNGTGLGLYIVKTTVEKLQGTIRLTSKPGKGTSFFINFKDPLS